MKKDISIIVPSIRPQNLIKLYQSIESACKKHSFELIIPSPYIIPDALLKNSNVRFIHTHANPTIAFQMAALLCSSDFIYNTTDDGLLQPDIIDKAISIFRSDLSEKDMINMTYIEGALEAATLEPTDSVFSNPHYPNFSNKYWDAHYHEPLRLAGINPSWKLCIHFLMKLDYFYELGGFDCGYEYANHAIHDLAFRAQINGSKVTNSPEIAFLCSHLPEASGDHGPVQAAQEGPDLLRFNELYSKPESVERRIKIDYNSWKDRDSVWKRRFPMADLPIRL
jgi:glycosyltransferase involved in cell wall biosynthesis